MSYINAVSIFMFILILYFLCILSKRLGEVLGMKKYYYLYYIGMVFTLVASVMITLTILNEKLQIVGDVFFALGLTLALLASIKYWGWLFKEIIRG